MKVVFVSNFLNHHQVPFCTKMTELCDEFRFIATDSISHVGYQQSTEADYVLHYFEVDKRAACEAWIREADAVIFGACPNDLITQRMKLGKLSFLFSERFFKKGTWRRFIPRTRRGVMERVARYREEPMYVLCASAYLTSDLSLLGFPSSKCYRWGYFPQFKQEDIEQLMERRAAAEVPTILWVARLIPLKHPELPIRIAKRLKAAGYDFRLNMIGDGDMMDDLSRMIRSYGLEDRVHLLGSLSTDEVRTHMETADIFLFTSNRREGWGAVMNEAMNSGCAVVANRAIGSVPYLIEPGKNGCVYDGSERGLYRAVEGLLKDPAQCRTLGEAAYRTIESQWNSDVAAERLTELIRQYDTRHTIGGYDSGPCSRDVR